METRLRLVYTFRASAAVPGGFTGTVEPSSGDAVYTKRSFYAGRAAVLSH